MDTRPRKIRSAIVRSLTLSVLALSVGGCADRGRDGRWERLFADPPAQFLPQPFWHLNGDLTTEEIRRQLLDAYREDNFGGVAFLPVSEGLDWRDGSLSPGMPQAFLSDEYFDRIRDMLDISRQEGRQVIFYDDADYPSGNLRGRIRDEFPHLTKKELNMREREFRGPIRIEESVPSAENFLGVVAMNAETFERIDLTGSVENGRLRWQAPEGRWKVMTFTLDRSPQGLHLIDYMDTAAVATFMRISYERYAERFSDHFGKTVTKMFFDDVGFFRVYRSWNPRVSRLFEERYGRSALLSYPALWYDIGPETSAIRTAFFGIRAELIGEGLPRMVAEWSARHNLSSIGHPPGNYAPSAVDMYGDPFKYYRHTQIPLLDAIHGYPYGRSGFKLIGSAADAFDKEIVGAELYGNYAADMDSLMLYRMAMECLVRGVNFLVPHGMWYDYGHVKIPPLISHYNPRIGPALRAYNTWAGRAVSLLQGGRRVTDIAVLYPIHALEAWYGFDDTHMTSNGKDVPPGTNYHNIGDWLTGELRYDFTYVHPELLADGARYSVGDGRLRLNTEKTGQEYRLMILPSGRVASVEALKVVQKFWECGGKVIAAGELPVQSAEFGRDAELARIVRTLFGPTPGQAVRSARGGEAVRLDSVSRRSLAGAIAALLPDPDVRFDRIADMTAPEDEAGRPLGVDRYREHSPAELGMFSYLHKFREGRDIYLFANSTDRPVDTWVDLKGDLALELWDPYTGRVEPWPESEIRRHGADEIYTRIHLKLNPVRSVFAVSK